MLVFETSVLTGSKYVGFLKYTACPGRPSYFLPAFIHASTWRVLAQ